MRLSTRSTYGMRALVELGLAAGHGPVSAAHIARRQGLSVAYLEQLLHRLKRHGFVGSVRGPRGGYVLARAPRDISMADVVAVLDGVAAPAGRSAGGNGQAKDPQRHAQRVAQAVWRCVHDRLAHALDAVSLQELCDQVGAAGPPLDHRYEFHI